MTDQNGFTADEKNLKNFAERLLRYVDTEHEFVEGSVVVSLSSPFGTGKTTFLNLWKRYIEEDDIAQELKKPSMVVDLNAWESDYAGEPLFAIIQGLIDKAERGTAKEELRDSAKRFGRLAFEVGMQVVNNYTGIDVAAAKEGASSDDIKSSDAYSLFEQKKAALDELKTAIKRIVEKEDSPRVLFLIDELDRCRPDYAISYLEAIKHFFDIQGAVFVLAVDRDQLKNSAKAAFGDGLKFDEYYRKFVQREVSLPPMNDQAYGDLADYYVGKYLSVESVRQCGAQLSDKIIGYFKALLASYKMTHRQIQGVFRTLGHILSMEDNDKRNVTWCEAIGTMFMLVMRTEEPDYYKKIGSGQVGHEEAVRLVAKPGSNRKGDTVFWFYLLLSGGGIKRAKSEKVYSVVKRANITDKADFDVENELTGRWEQGWGGPPSKQLQTIHRKIEEVGRFADGQIIKF